MNKGFILIIGVISVFVIVTYVYQSVTLDMNYQAEQLEQPFPLTIKKEEVNVYIQEGNSGHTERKYKFTLTGQFQPYTILGDNCKCCVIQKWYEGLCLNQQYVCGKVYPSWICNNKFTFQTDVVKYTLSNGTTKTEEFPVADEYTSFSYPILIDQSTAEASSVINFEVTRKFHYQAVLIGPCRVDYEQSGISSSQKKCYIRACPYGENGSTTVIKDLNMTVLYSEEWINENAPPVFQETGNIYGHVKDNDGNPLKANLTISGETITIQVVYNTDNNGYFQFNELIQGEYVISCFKEGYIEQRKSIVVNPNEETEVNFTLQKSQNKGTVKGVVKDQNGKTLNNVKIEISTVSSYTDATGTYIVTINQGNYMIKASKEGYKSVSHLVSIAPNYTTVQDFTLSSNITTGAISGTVRNADQTVEQLYTINGAQVTFYGVTLEGAEVVAGQYKSTTDNNGNFLISDIPAGTYDVIASKQGYKSVTLDNINVKEGNTTLVYFNLPPEATVGEISGNIQDMNGNAIIMVKIEIQGSQFSTVIFSKNDGSFAVSNLKEGEYHVIFSKEKFKPLDLYCQVSDGEITSMHIYLVQEEEKDENIVNIIPTKPIPSSGVINTSDMTIWYIAIIFTVIFAVLLYMIHRKGSRRKKRRNQRR